MNEELIGMIVACVMAVLGTIFGWNERTKRKSATNAAKAHTAPPVKLEAQRFGLGAAVLGPGASHQFQASLPKDARVRWLHYECSIADAGGIAVTEVRVGHRELLLGPGPMPLSLLEDIDIGAVKAGELIAIEITNFSRQEMAITIGARAHTVEESRLNS